MGLVVVVVGGPMDAVMTFNIDLAADMGEGTCH